MYNKTKSPFENYWLALAEVNLKFAREVTKLNPDKVKVYAAENAWLGCGKSTDRMLQRRYASSEKLAMPSAHKKEGDSGYLTDFFKKISNSGAEGYRPKNQREIYQEYQQLTESIISTLERINERQRARREESGIKAKIQKSISEDEAVAIALRAALRNRK